MSTSIPTALDYAHVRNGPGVSVHVYNVNADGTGTAGTDQSAKIQACVDANAGGKIFFPAAPLAYVVWSAIIVPSNTTIEIQPGATVQKKFGAAPTGATGCTAVFEAGDGTSAVSNIWFTGGGIIDGNRDNVTGIVGDGFNAGIFFRGASHSGIQDLTIKNCYTGGVAIDGWGSPATGVGDNIQIINTIITNSRRSNLEVLCGTNVQMTGGELSYATGGSLSLGFDVEPYQAGGFCTGFSITGTAIHHNRDGGGNLVPVYDSGGFYSFIDLDCHTNGTYGINCVDFHAGVTGTVRVIGGCFKDNIVAGDIAAIRFNNWKMATVSGGAILLGNARGILFEGISAGQVGVVTSGSIAGTSFDLSVDTGWDVTLSGTTLVTGVLQGAAQIKYGTTIIPLSATTSGLAYWPGSSPRTGAMAISAEVTLIGSTNPGILCSDGTITTKLQASTGGGYGLFGTQSAHPLAVSTNNSPRLLIDSTGNSFFNVALTTQSSNYIASETGANNALIAALPLINSTSPTLAAGYRIALKLAHTLQVGANTLTMNGSTKSILRHTNLGNLATAYSVGSIVDLMYDGTQWQDMGQ